jgi:hypothetical protein
MTYFHTGHFDINCAFTSRLRKLTRYLVNKERDTTKPVDERPKMTGSEQENRINALGDKGQSLQTFDLADLQQFTREKTYAANASKDFHLFYVGRDDVHDILKYVLSRVSVSLYLNMFGFDDEELNDILMAKAKDPHVTMMITLDKSQAGGVHEKKLLNADVLADPTKFNTYVVIGQSATHQISHTKGFVADSRVAGEGSTNWSASGEGTFVVKEQPGGKGYKAQNNTQSIITDPDTVSRFQSELIAEHMAARVQSAVNGAEPKKVGKASNGASVQRGRRKSATR